MAIWSVVRRKVFNGCNSSYSSSIIGKSWKCKSSTASHTRYYGALSKETSVFVRGSPVSLPCYLGSSLSSNAIMRVTVSYNHTFNTSIRLFSSDEGGSVDAVVPYMGESISDGTLATILKKPGDRVEADEPIAQIETDKVTIDISSPTAGTIEKIVAKEGDTVEPGFKIAVISKSSGAATNVEDSEKKPEETKPEKKEEKPKPVAEPPPSPKVETSPPKEKSRAPPPPPPVSGASPREPQLPQVPMTRLRKRVATRLKDSQNTFALLYIFNYPESGQI